MYAGTKSAVPNACITMNRGTKDGNNKYQNGVRKGYTGPYAYFCGCGDGTELWTAVKEDFSNPCPTTHPEFYGDFSLCRAQNPTTKEVRGARHAVGMPAMSIACTLLASPLGHSSRFISVEGQKLLGPRSVFCPERSRALSLQWFIGNIEPTTGKCWCNGCTSDAGGVANPNYQVLCTKTDRDP